MEKSSDFCSKEKRKEIESLFHKYSINIKDYLIYINF